MDRIEKTFNALAKSGRKGLITFIMGGDPNLSASQGVLDALPGAGADIIEIGIPFSDPMADGPVIQAAGLRALSAGTQLKDVLGLVTTFRIKNHATPIILMGYYNPVYHYGVKAFCEAALLAGVDGVILVDLPPEEEEEFVSIADNYNIKLIRLIAPTTEDKRLEMLTRHAGGFLYYIAIAGITGTKSADMETLQTRLGQLKLQTKLPVVAGFGIKTPEQAAQTAQYCDAVVVGSALVDVIQKQGMGQGINFVKSLSHTLNPVL
jgi:tryptophan synthase alpha chain